MIAFYAVLWKKRGWRGGGGGYTVLRMKMKRLGSQCHSGRTLPGEIKIKAPLPR